MVLQTACTHWPAHYLDTFAVKWFMYSSHLLNNVVDEKAYLCPWEFLLLIISIIHTHSNLERLVVQH